MRPAAASLREAALRARELRLPWIPLVVIGTLLVCALFAPWLAPHDPTHIDVLVAKRPPGANLSYPLGTDLLGRDMLSRLMYGSRTAVYVIVVALGAGALIGTVIGLVSGYVGGKLDAVLMRIADAVLGFPTILVALVVVVIVGPGTLNIVAAVALTVWPNFARMVRGDTLVIKQADFVTLARVAGVPGYRIIVRHILPNLVSTLAILLSLRIGQVILLEASLSFLGIGLPPGAPAWGIMVSEGRNLVVNAWWLSTLPGLAITAVVLSFNLMGDWLRDHLDPKFRQL
ncbi:MAG TPA: ABC transporter permease [Sinomonas sp.]|nr:ABC transporter permease [Sinomonas sp.]